MHSNLDLALRRFGFDCQIWSPAMQHIVAAVLYSWCHVMLLPLDRPTFALKNVNIWYKQRFVAAGALYHVMLLLVDRADLEALKLTRDGDGMPLKRRVMRPLSRMERRLHVQILSSRNVWSFCQTLLKQTCQHLDLWSMQGSFWPHLPLLEFVTFLNLLILVV